MDEILKVNDVTFIFSPFKDLETASLGIFLKIGSRIEKNNLKGIAHFLEHILFKGSKKYSYRQIKREIEGRGGSLNGFTSQEITGYYAHFLNKNLKPALDILIDMVFNPLIKVDDVEKERKVILEEIKMYNDLPSSRVQVLLDKLLWKNHPLGIEVIGDFPTVNNIKREDLLNFKEDYYIPSNMIISCSGDFSKSDLVDLLNKKIEKRQIKKTKPVKSEPPSCRGIHINIERKKLEQSYLCSGFRSFSYRSKERFIGELVNIILGANMSSRLFEEIREKKALCYDISTEARKYEDSGAFIIQLGLDKSNIVLAFEAILKELKKIKENKVSFKELERAKDFFIGQISMGLERPQGRMFYCAESYLTTDKVYTLKEIKEKIKNIETFHIRDFSRQIFKFQNICVACVGDIREGEEEKIKIITDKYC